jgi:hypothetical protein
MGTDCYGWVEVRDPTTPASAAPGFPNWWSGVIRINDIVERDYRVFGYFFGVRNPFDAAVAGRRGIPVQLSEEALADAADPTDMHAASWLLWSEVQASDWRSMVELTPGWGLLFSLMEQLAAHFGDERVRLVVWFDDGLGV